MITIYTIAYNEQVLLQFMIDHYRQRFPDCKIVVYDNMSTDRTKQIALNNKCTVIPYDTKNKLNDHIYLEIKNNCWKQAETDWVLICDVDELLDITKQNLLLEQKKGTTIVMSEAYQMINMKNNFNLKEINRGVRDPGYDKKFLFNKQYIKEINYGIGCHGCEPVGNIILSQNKYKLYHYKYINQSYHIKRYKLFESRLSDFNLTNKIGMGYCISPLDIKYEYFSLRNRAIKLF